MLRLSPRESPIKSQEISVPQLEGGLGANLEYDAENFELKHHESHIDTSITYDHHDYNGESMKRSTSEIVVSDKPIIQNRLGRVVSDPSLGENHHEFVGGLFL